MEITRKLQSESVTRLYILKDVCVDESIVLKLKLRNRMCRSELVCGLKYIKPRYCELFYMGVKRGLSHYGKSTG